jgi:hypothetical protein
MRRIIEIIHGRPNLEPGLEDALILSPLLHKKYINEFIYIYDLDVLIDFILRISMNHIKES